MLPTHNEMMLTRRALGMQNGNSVRRNFLAVRHDGSDIEVASRLAGKGWAVRDPAADFGSMRVFRITAEGAKAVGKRLPPERTFIPTT